MNILIDKFEEYRDGGVIIKGMNISAVDSKWLAFDEHLGTTSWLEPWSDSIDRNRILYTAIAEAVEYQPFIGHLLDALIIRSA